MGDIINIGTFIQQLTYYVKIGIYINKGTDKDAILERCIKLYNKYKIIEASTEITDEDEIFVRKCLKRLNLILKVDSNGNPVDIRNKENQIKIIYLEGHPSILNNNMAEMIEYANKYNIAILTEIPLTFILRESKYQELLWQYTRSLFYISQLIISKIDQESNEKTINAKKKVYDNAAEQLEPILTSISEIEEKIKLDQILTLDKFLNTKLVKTGINEKNVNEARQEVKEIFMKKGLGADDSMGKMIDSISDKLTTIDLSKGNIIQNMFGIAQNVAQEMRGDLENNPENFQNTIGAITEVFQDAMEDSSKNGEDIPPELKDMFNVILSSASTPENMSKTILSTIGQTNDLTEDEIAKSLENIIQINGLNRDDFYGMIKNNDGEIDINKLEKILVGLNN